MADTPHVLFLVLDSMRLDRVSTYGHDVATTPTLDELATTATVHENAFVPAPWTLPSHCSMFTGLFPSEHGVTTGFADATRTLPEEHPTVAERLRERGYRTAGFSNNPWVGTLSGLDRGFDTFVEWDLEISRGAGADIHSRRDRVLSRLHGGLAQAARQPVFLLKRRFFTANLVERATRWLTRSTSGPTFTFLNLMEAHSPYFPPAWTFRELGFEPPGVVEPRLLNTKLLAYVMGKRDLGDEERRRILEYYDASLRYQDRQVGRLVSTLRDRDMFENTLLVICADHGKTLGEYDRSGRPPHYVRDINTNVPLLVKRPGQTSGERDECIVELTALFDLFVDTPSAKLEPGATGVALTEDVLPHTGRTTPGSLDRWRMVTSHAYKYARSDDGEEFLFAVEGGRDRLLDDPDPSRLERFRAALDERVNAMETTVDAGPGSRIDGSVRSQLHDLGYI